MAWSPRWVSTISADGRRIHLRAPTGLPRSSRALAKKAAMALGASLRGREALHVTSLDGPRGTIGFLGDPGTGKSTLAAFLLKRGWKLWSDDVAFVGKSFRNFRAPGPVWLKLRGKVPGHFVEAPRLGYDPVFRKSVFDLGGSPRKFPVDALVELRRMNRGPVRIHHLRGARAALMVVSHLYNGLVRPDRVRRRQLITACRLAEKLPVWRVLYPTGFTHLPRVEQCLHRLMARR